jgi:hypothetical protein
MASVEAGSNRDIVDLAIRAFPTSSFSHFCRRVLDTDNRGRKCPEQQRDHGNPLIIRCNVAPLAQCAWEHSTRHAVGGEKARPVATTSKNHKTREGGLWIDLIDSQIDAEAA